MVLKQIYGPITNLLSILRILTGALTRAHAKGERSFTDFKCVIFIVRFPSDGTASTAVKGLILYSQTFSVPSFLHIHNCKLVVTARSVRCPPFP